MGDGIYLRISKDRQGLELGVDRQDGDCVPLARPGFRRFTDNDLSATKGRRRAGYEALMEAVKAGEVDRIICWSTGRLWRNRRERAEGLEVLKAAKVQVVPFKGPTIDCSSAAGRALVGMLGEFDTWETDTMAERLEAESLQRAEAGGYAGGPRPFAYKADGMRLERAEAKLLKRWYAEFLAGRSITSIAREAGKGRAAIRHIIRNPRNCGLRVLRGKEYRGKWKPIVTEEVWRAAVAILDDPDRRKNAAAAARKWLGSGLYTCHRCDGLPVVTARNPHNQRVYRCTPDQGGCSKVWRADAVDDFVVAAVADRLRVPELAKLLPRNRPDLDALRTERKALRTRLDKLASSWALGLLDDAQLAAAGAAARGRAEEVEAAIAEATKADAVDEMLDHDDPGAAWLAIPVDQVERRQRVIRGLATVVLDESPRGRALWTPALVLGRSRWAGDAKTWAALYIDGRDTP